MAPFNVEAAEKYLVAIPLVSLSNEPIRIPTSVVLERLHTTDSRCSPAKDHCQNATVHGGKLNTYRAECFLTSLQLEDPNCPSEDFQATETATGNNAEPEKMASDNRLAPGQAVIRAKLRSGLFGRIGRQASPPSFEMSESQSVALDNTRKGPMARAMRAMGCAAIGPWAQRKETWSHVTGTSYASYLVPTKNGKYDPDFLDDQDLHPEECQEVSVIPFVRSRGPKEELNEEFRQRHPGINASITLSKLRNLQKDLREITCVVPELDISTVALAWVYFEKLVMGDYVRKSNRKLLAGACLVLAFKFNQHGDRKLLSQLAVCIRKLDRKDQLDLAALHEAELKVFCWLEFSLYVGQDAYAPHLHRLLKGLDSSATEYYGAGWNLYANPQCDAPCGSSNSLAPMRLTSR